MNKWLMLTLAAIILTACGNKVEQTGDSEQNKQLIEEGTVGFEVMGNSIEEASGVPEEEKKAILEAFEEYINAFNSKDIDRYINTLSKKPNGFSIEEDRVQAQMAFEQYDITKSASDMTIVKYSKEEAQVYANIVTDTKEIATGAELSSEGRQVTVFVKENGAWKVTSIYYIGNQE